MEVCTLKEILEKLIWEALLELYYNDNYLIKHEPILKFIPEESRQYVSERAIVFRFGIYLQKFMCANDSLKDYHLDCEYNRNLDAIKKLGSQAIIPDLIIHKRGSMEENLLVMEFKSWWNRNNEKDKEKINELLNPDGDYRYEYGLIIRIDKKYPPKLEWGPFESKN